MGGQRTCSSSRVVCGPGRRNGAGTDNFWRLQSVRQTARLIRAAMGGQSHLPKLLSSKRRKASEVRGRCFSRLSSLRPGKHEAIVPLRLWTLLLQLCIQPFIGDAWRREPKLADHCLVRREEYR